MVAADAGIENQAAEKVQTIAAAHPQINTLVMGAPELALVRQRMEQLNIGLLRTQIGLSGYGAVRNLGLVVPQINTLVMGAPELALVRQRMEQLNIGLLRTQIGLSGYGAVRNLGLVVANTLGFDAVVFLDDDEVIDEPHFLQRAMYGLGKLTKKGIPILAKTGYYLNEQGSYLSKWEDKWYNHFWQQGRAFNEWISSAMKGPRLSRSNHVCGGCLAVHKEAFKRLAFDPWIARGEDLDYMLNLRMYGSDIWFDNKWVLRHLPPKTQSEGDRFRQDIFRWIYEYRKLEFRRALIDLQWFDNKWVLRHLPPKTQSEGDRFRQDIFRWIYEYRKLEFRRALIDLQQDKPQSLEPYPGPFLEPGLVGRIRRTAFLRSLGRPTCFFSLSGLSRSVWSWACCRGFWA